MSIKVIDILSEQKKRHLYEILCQLLERPKDSYSHIALEACFTTFCNRTKAPPTSDTVEKILSMQNYRNIVGNSEMILSEWHGVLIDERSFNELKRVLKPLMGRKIHIIITGG